MQWSIIDSDCKPRQLLITQEQGDNTPTIINFPYDITGFTFEGTVNFPAPISLSIGSGITVENKVIITGSISKNILTVSAVSSGTVYVNMPVSGVGILPGTFVTSFGTGTGTTGTYYINQAQTVASMSIAAGQISMQLTSAQTQDVAEGQYPFDLWSITSGLNPINTPVLQGFFEINLALTKIT